MPVLSAELDDSMQARDGGVLQEHVALGGAPHRAECLVRDGLLSQNLAALHDFQGVFNPASHREVLSAPHHGCTCRLVSMTQRGVVKGSSSFNKAAGQSYYTNSQAHIHTVPLVFLPPDCTYKDPA